MSNIIGKMIAEDMAREILGMPSPVNFETKYYGGHESGWTDDLGIIADRNRWVEAVAPGWYCNFYTIFSTANPHVHAMYTWCKETIKNDWKMLSNGFYFEEEKDAMLFTLKWSGK